MEKRSDSIDIMRGIGIFLVVFAHILKQNNVFSIKDWIYSLHMPLFFFISGMFIKKNELFKSFFWKKLVTIVIPYFVWAAISLLYWVLIESRFRTIDDFNLIKGILGIPYANGNWLPYNEVLWFLPVLFITSIIFKCTLNIRCRKTRIVFF